MRLEAWIDPMERVSTFRLTIPDDEMVEAQFSELDKRFMREASQPDASISSILMALETIAYRIEVLEEKKRKQREEAK